MLHLCPFIWHITYKFVITLPNMFFSLYIHVKQQSRKWCSKYTQKWMTHYIQKLQADYYYTGYIECLLKTDVNTFLLSAYDLLEIVLPIVSALQSLPQGT